MTSKPGTRSWAAVPILQGIRPFHASRLSTDALAGATLAALAIPEVMGYTRIAGVPVITGLYTILLPIVVFAVFGSSRHLVVGADSATAAILATGLLASGAAAGSPEYVALAGLAALMCAVLLILARLLGLGFIADFLSRSVLIGFLTGVGIQVAIGQVAGMFGVDAGGGNTLEKFANTLRAIPGSTSLATLSVSVAVLVVILALGRLTKRIPAALIAVIGAIAVSYALDLSVRGVSVLGTVPGGLPGLGLPQDVMTASSISALLPMVASMSIVILAQSAATARAYALKYDDPFDANADLVGLGLANLAAGLTGAFPVNGSPTKTEMVDGAGGRSQVAQLTTAGIVIVVLLFLTGPLAYMPNAVLSAVVFLIGLRLVDFRGMRDIARVRRGEFAVALLTAVVVVAIGVEEGIVLAIILSVIVHIEHSYHPFDTLLSLSPEGRFAFSGVEDGAQALPGLAMYHFGSSLYYANAPRFIFEILDTAEHAHPPLRWFCLSASAIGDVDYSGADAVRAVVDGLKRRGVTFTLCDVSVQVRHLLDAYGLTEMIGREHIHETARDVLEAYRRTSVAAAP